MLISTKGRYALRMMIAMANLQAKERRPISLKEISESESISAKYLEQLAHSLAAENVIVSSRGKYGGYKLARPANQILAGDIIRAAEGSTAPVSCLEDGAECPREAICTTIRFWAGLDSVINGYVNAFTLEDLLSDCPK